MKNPFIHLFESENCFYMYDVNTDKILNIPEEVYRYLKENRKFMIENIENESIRTYIEYLVEQGFLKSTHVEVSEHPESKYLRCYLENRMSSIVLQVTQNCNLRCEYCVYSGSYFNRVHNNKRMSLEMAIKGIEFLATHSRDSESVHIATVIY